MSGQPLNVAASKRLSLRIVLLLCGLIGLMIALVVSFLQWRKGIPTPPPVPHPNGYEDLVQAAASVIGEEPDLETAPIEDIQLFVDQNRRPLELVRVGLGRECRVPIKYSQADLEIGVSRLGPIQRLARVLIAEGKLAEHEGQNADAVRSYLDGVRLGHEMARGGLFVDRLTGGALESIAVEALHGLRAKLDGGTCRELIRVLEKIESQREPFEEVLASERTFNEALISEMGLRALLGRPTMRKLARAADPVAEVAAKRAQARLRLLVVELAIRCHLMEDGRHPESLTALTPRYLVTVPSDPFGGNSFVYRVQSDGYRLYSIGPNLKDDGGMAMSEPSGSGPADGDLFLDPGPTAPQSVEP